jgi:type IV secretion system protein TrbL
MEVGMLTEILNKFVDAFSGGFQRLQPAINGLLRVFVTIDVLFFCALLLFELEQWKSAFRKIFVLSLWMYVIRDFDVHATRVINSLVQAGLMAAGQGGADARAIINPSRILDAGFQATDVLAKNLTNAGPLDIADVIAFGFSYMLIVLAFAALALNAFMAMLEYYLAMAIAGIFLPFAVLQPTRWVAMKPISFLLASGMKMMVLSFLLAIINPILASIRFRGDEPDLREIWVMVCVAGSLAVVSWIVPQRFAQGFMSGSASLGASDAVPVLAGAAMAAAPAVGMAFRGAKSMGSAAWEAFNDRRLPDASRPAASAAPSPSSRPSTASPGLLASATTSPALSAGSGPPELAIEAGPGRPPPALPPGAATASVSRADVPLAIFEES